MGAVNEAWLSTLEAIEAASRKRAAGGIDRRWSDAELWDMALEAAPAELLPAASDAGLLAELREAYDAGVRKAVDPAAIDTASIWTEDATVPNGERYTSPGGWALEWDRRAGWVLTGPEVKRDLGNDFLAALTRATAIVKQAAVAPAATEEPGDRITLEWDTTVTTRRQHTVPAAELAAVLGLTTAELFRQMDKRNVMAADDMADAAFDGLLIDIEQAGAMHEHPSTDERKVMVIRAAEDGDIPDSYEAERYQRKLAAGILPALLEGARAETDRAHQFHDAAAAEVDALKVERRDLRKQLAAAQAEIERLKTHVAEMEAEDDDEAPDTDTILEWVREAVAKHEADAEPDEPKAVGVIFYPYEYDDGYFYAKDDAKVVYADGSTDNDIELPDAIDSLLSAYGRIGHNGAVGVRLADGEFNDDDYASDVEGWLGVKPERL